jgi:hypothetical protein
MEFISLPLVVKYIGSITVRMGPTNNSINFLDITITKTPDRLSYKVYRKPTITNTIIPNDSCNLVQHKLAAIKFLTNSHDSYHLDSTNKQIKNGIIDQILHSNGYDASHTHKPPTPQTCYKSLQPGTKWACFTYVSRETRYITKLFPHTPIQVAYTT